MKKIGFLFATVIMMMLFSFSVIATENGTNIRNAIILKNNTYYTKTWTDSNYYLNCYNKIVISKDGYITFTSNIIINDDGEIFPVDLTLLDKNGKEVWGCETTYASELSLSDANSYKIGLGKGIYYMNITPGFGVYSDTIGSDTIKFKYKYSFKESNNWEKEPNGSVAKATPISLNKTYTGVYCESNYGEEYDDNYSFTLKKGKEYTITISNFAELDEGTVITDFFDPDGEELYLGYGETKGNTQVWTFTAEKSGKYIYRFCNASDEKPVEYKIKVSGKGDSSSSHKHSYKTTKTTKATLTKNGKVTKKCSSCGETKSTTIYYPKSIKLSATSYSYNGKVKTPSLSVKDSKGNSLKKDTDYTVKYSKGRKNIGTYTVTVTFKGKYEGSKKLKFTIAPKTITDIKVKSKTSKTITLSWSKSTGATGYEVYQYSSIKSKYILKGTVKTTSYKVTGLKGNTSYKFKVRPYTKLGDGTVVLGRYSSVFTMKTKLGYGVNISGNSATLYVGDTKQLKAITVPENKAITWKSSNKSIAAVSSSGKVTAKAHGTATITASFEYKGKSYKDTYKITVKSTTNGDCLGVMAACGINQAYNSAKYPSTLHLNSITYGKNKTNGYGDTIDRMVLKCYAANSLGGYGEIYVVVIRCNLGYYPDAEYVPGCGYISTSVYSNSPGNENKSYDNKDAMKAYQQFYNTDKVIPYD